MFHNRHNHNKVKHLHEICRHRVHNDKLSSYEELLEKDGSVSIHHKNIQSVFMEMFYIKYRDSPEIVSNIFLQTTEHYNFKQN